MENTVVTYKSEDSMWQMLVSGKKEWEARAFDMTDDRVRRLAAGHWEKSTRPGRNLHYVPNEEFVCFENKATGQTLQFRYRGMQMAGWAPGWFFILLGSLVATIDKDGGPAV